MSLKSLVGVSLDTITPARETAQRLIAAAARNIADAKIKAVSAETRFCRPVMRSGLPPRTR